MLTNPDWYQQLVETMIEGVILVNAATGHIVYANPSAERILGLTRSHIENRTYDDTRWQIVDTNDVPLSAAEYPTARVLATHAPVYDLTVGIYRPDGDIRWLSVNAAPVTMDSQLTGVIATFSDISELHITLKTMRELQQMYESTLRIIGEALRQANNHQLPIHVPFNRRERAVLHLVAQGLSNAEIALDLGISKKTVDNRLSAIYAKTRTNNRVQLTLYAQQNGLVNPPTT